MKGRENDGLRRETIQDKAAERLMIQCQYEEDLVDELVEINTKISKLLEDE